MNNLLFVGNGYFGIFKYGFIVILKFLYICIELFVFIVGIIGVV